MDADDHNRRPAALRMTTGKNPWDPRDTETTGENIPPAETAAQSGGLEPRNPWLNQDTDPRPRRSAHIDDILRQRGSNGTGLRPRWLGAIFGTIVAAWIAARKTQEGLYACAN